MSSFDIYSPDTRHRAGPVVLVRLVICLSPFAAVYNSYYHINRLQGHPDRTGWRREKEGKKEEKKSLIRNLTSPYPYSHWFS